VILLAGCVAPFINAARFSGSVKDAVEFSLGRKVQFERVYFTLFSGPGFALEGVTISEDPRYGPEPFAYVPTLQARLRPDKLLAGQIRLASLRLVSPSLNLVKRSDGSWNVIELVERMSAPRRSPLNLFPTFEISDGRVDFKLGLRKTTLYISETDLSIYPEQSGKVYFRFSGSPARSDRAGMGFGHLRGSVNWFLNRSAAGDNQVEAEVTLDPSNLSELTTLLEGHDAGVHGTVSSRIQIEGPATGLKVKGELRLNDVHRWDLLPASGEEWTIHYGGDIDLLAHRIDLKTLPSQPGQPTPVTMRLRVNDFLSHASSSTVAELRDAPLEDLLPIAMRMGVAWPKGAELHGAVSGGAGYSSEGGWSGGLVIAHAEAVRKGVPPLRAAAANVTIFGDHIHFDPAAIDSSTGSLKMNGDYFFADQRASATLNASSVSLDDLRPLANSWFGKLGPLSAMSDGLITGQFSYLNDGLARAAGNEAVPAWWSGQFAVSDATISIPGLATPLAAARARVSFHDANVEVDRLSADLDGQIVHGSYRFNALAQRAEHAHIELASADLARVQDALAAGNRASGFWANFRFGRRWPPPWLTKRNLDGELVIERLLADGQMLGTLHSTFTWKGASLQFHNVSLKLAQGEVNARGSVNLASSDPQWRFSAKASDYPWGGGRLRAEGQFASAGTGKDLLRNLTAAGSFNGESLALSPTDTFDEVAGDFRFTFLDGWPDLHLSNIQAIQNGDEWNGEGLTESSGKLLVTLDHAGHQVHFVSSLTGDSPLPPLSGLPRAGGDAQLFSNGQKF